MKDSFLNRRRFPPIRIQTQWNESNILGSGTHGNVAGGGQDTVDSGFGEGVEGSLGTPHEIRLQQITAVAVVLELALIQLEGQIRSLEVQRHQLTAGIPESLS